MARTAHLHLPLVMPAQAQKHVTLNEALARLDAAAQLHVASSTLNEPPSSASEGESYLIPEGSTGEWQGRTGQIAVWSNGSWIYLEPRSGWRAWDSGASRSHMFDGVKWTADAAMISAGGATTLSRIIEFDHTVTEVPINTTTVQIPRNTQIIGVTGRVLVALTGVALVGWRIGVAGAENRYGSGLGTARNSFLVGLSGSPVTYYSPTPLVLSAEGGTFSGGVVRLALHCISIDPPRAV